MISLIVTRPVVGIFFPQEESPTHILPTKETISCHPYWINTDSIWFIVKNECLKILSLVEKRICWSTLSPSTTAEKHLRSMKSIWRWLKSRQYRDPVPNNICKQILWRTYSHDSLPISTLLYFPSSNEMPHKSLVMKDFSRNIRSNFSLAWFLKFHSSSIQYFLHRTKQSLKIECNGRKSLSVEIGLDYGWRGKQILLATSLSFKTIAALFPGTQVVLSGYRSRSFPLDRYSSFDNFS